MCKENTKKEHIRKQTERYKENLESEKAAARRQMEKNKTKTKNSRIEAREAQIELNDMITEPDENVIKEEG